MPWYYHLMQLVSGMILTNGIPHFVQGLSGNPFQSPFASPPGRGESSPLSNALWGFGNLVGGAVLLWFFSPGGEHAWIGWICVGLGSLLASIVTSIQFGKVRAQKSH